MRALVVAGFLLAAALGAAPSVARAQVAVGPVFVPVPTLGYGTAPGYGYALSPYVMYGTVPAYGYPPSPYSGVTVVPAFDYSAAPYGVYGYPPSVYDSYAALPSYGYFSSPLGLYGTVPAYGSTGLPSSSVCTDPQSGQQLIIPTANVFPAIAGNCVLSGPGQ